MIIIPEFKDLTGKVFGAWTVVERAPNRVTSSGNTFTVWKCVCNCGTKRDVVTNSLLSGRSTSCGCATKTSRAECAKRTFLEHGESKSRLYRIWAGMKKRCTNKNSMNYYLYGGRGITVCDEWQEYIPFRDWSMCNGYTDELTIDRIDTNKGYSPENCRWSNQLTQSNNRRSNVRYTINGETHTIAEWVRQYNANYKNVYKKIKRGVPIEKALEQS